MLTHTPDPIRVPQTCATTRAVYTLAHRLFLPEAEVKKAEATLEAERLANEAAVAMYKARRVCRGLAGWAH